MASFNLNNIFPKPAYYRNSAVADQRLVLVRQATTEQVQDRARNDEADDGAGFALERFKAGVFVGLDFCGHDGRTGWFEKGRAVWGRGGGASMRKKFAATPASV